MPRLNPFPARGWEVVFGVAVAWFGGQAIRGYRHGPRGHAGHHLPHLLVSVAMVYVILPVSPARAADAMPAGVPGLALVLALALFGYAIWTTDRLNSLAPATSAFAAAARSGAAGAPPMSRRLAACRDIVTGTTMGYMLIVML